MVISFGDSFPSTTINIKILQTNNLIMNKCILSF